jgi:hypothetical protein
VPALFEETGLVDDQHGVRRAEPLDHVVAAQVARGLLVPEHVAEHPLGTPGTRLPEVLGELPAVLALDRAKQPFKIAPRLRARLGAHQQPAEPDQQRLQLLPPAAHLRQRRHARPSLITRVGLRHQLT